MTSLKSFLFKALALGLVVWAVYWNSLDNPLHFDDWHVIGENPAVHRLENIPSFFTDISAFSILPGNQDYRPVFLVSMALGWWIADGETWPFHLTSVSLHLANCLLLVLILLLLFEKGRDPVRLIPRRERQTAAWLGGLLFAVHPLASQTINYVSNQSVLWAAFFYLLGFYLFTRIYSGPPPNLRLVPWLVRGLAYASYFLALLSKPIAITLPVNLFLWECLLGPAPARPQKESLPLHYGRRLLKYFPYAGISLFYLWMRSRLVPQAFELATQARPLFDHTLTQIRALILFYLRLGLFPWRQNADVEYPVSTSLLDPRVLLALLVLVAAVAFLIRFRRQRLLVFWALWFPVAISITTFAVILIQVVSEHRIYLSLAGLCGLLATLWLKARASLPFQFWDFSLGPRAGRALLSGAVIIPLMLFAAGTRERNRVWSSSLNLWRDAALHGGTWRAHMNYALALEETEEKEEALAQFKEAVRLSPNAWAHINLGNAYMRRGAHDLGLWHLRQAVQLWPELSDAHLYLGYGLQRVGRNEEAEAEFQRAVRLRANYLNAHRALAGFYERQDRPGEALAAYRALLQVDPTQSWVREKIQSLESGEGPGAEASLSLALQWIRENNYRKAVELLTPVYRDHPRHPGILFNLAFSHQRLGNREKANRIYEELLQVEPIHVQGNFNLAYSYRDGDSVREWMRSAELFRKVLELQPSYSEALFHLATVLRKLDRREEARRYDQRYLEEGTHADLKRQARKRLAAGSN